MEKVDIFPTVTWSAGPGCHGGCGQKLYVKDGRLIKVEGDENNPWNQGRACPRVLALTQYAYHPDRIIYPLKRVGKRGEGKFERISWDEALDTVAISAARSVFSPIASAVPTGASLAFPGSPVIRRDLQL